MKTVFLAIILILISGCSDLVRLNNRIYEEQWLAISESPYKDAPVGYTYVNLQKEERLKIFKELFKSTINQIKSSDTIYLMESFDAICTGCSSFLTKALIGDTVYTLFQEVLGHKGGIKYIFEKEEFKPGYNDLKFESKNTELVEVAGKVKSGIHWKNDPLQYGIENCADGDHTIITVIYPDQNIEALYVRCWLPVLNRKTE